MNSKVRLKKKNFIHFSRHTFMVCCSVKSTGATIPYTFTDVFYCHEHITEYLIHRYMN